MLSLVMKSLNLFGSEKENYRRLKDNIRTKGSQWDDIERDRLIEPVGRITAD